MLRSIYRQCSCMHGASRMLCPEVLITPQGFDLGAEPDRVPHQRHSGRARLLVPFLLSSFAVNAVKLLKIFREFNLEKNLLRLPFFFACVSALVLVVWSAGFQNPRWPQAEFSTLGVVRFGSWSR